MAIKHKRYSGFYVEIKKYLFPIVKLAGYLKIVSFMKWILLLPLMKYGISSGDYSPYPSLDCS
jgi:hypothetical protein